jgi:hypothetical protein
LTNVSASANIPARKINFFFIKRLLCGLSRRQFLSLSSFPVKQGFAPIFKKSSAVPVYFGDVPHGGGL